MRRLLAPTMHAHFRADFQSAAGAVGQSCTSRLLRERSSAEGQMSKNVDRVTPMRQIAPAD